MLGSADTHCWEWGGQFDKEGRPIWREQYAYRIIYSRVIGTPPPGKDAHHRCRNKRCVNPWHLEFLTPEEHRRVHKAGGNEYQSSKTECPQKHPYNESNTYVYTRKNGKAERHCRACHRERARQRS